MQDPLKLLQQANDRLKVGKIGVTLATQGKGNWIYLRGTFPCKPGENRRPYSTKIALEMRAIDKQSVDAAETIARQVGLDLNLGRFDWRKFSDFEDPTNPEAKTVGDWIEQFEKDWWMTRDRTNQAHRNTWQTAYFHSMRHLPRDVTLTEELLVKHILDRTPPNTQNRRHFVTCCKMLAETAGLSINKIKLLTPKIPVKPVNPRNVPEDLTIAQLSEEIKDPGWQYIYRLMATYGLRNHEAFYADYADFPILRVRSRTKTGSRPVKALYPEWAEQWNLSEVIYPSRIQITEETSNQRLGQAVSTWFTSHSSFTAYNLRHAYARRCVHLGITPVVAARLMGHSLQVHEQVYQAWIGESVFLDAVDRALERSDRPLPPEI
ncbi:MAG: hypothetical protein MUC48_21550 [Leptolyngbya sp. Prado105]|jgi:integrase|nr:hypothetical protein [Leptolyngbya sp. Prado105]